MVLNAYNISYLMYSYIFRTGKLSSILRDFSKLLLTNSRTKSRAVIIVSLRYSLFPNHKSFYSTVTIFIYTVESYTMTT
jgi:hypothetical protein